MRAVGAQQTSGSRGPGSWSHRQPPFVLSAPCPLQPPSPWSNPATAPAPSPAPQPPPGFQQQQLWGPQPRLPRPHTAPSPAVPRCRAKELEGSATQETNVLGASPAPFPRARRAPVTSASSSPPLRPPRSKPQARSPRVPVPRRPLPGVPCVHQTLPGAAPSVSAVLARAAPEPSPSWRRSWRPRLGARHSPGGRGAAPAPRARAGRHPRAACPRASVQRAGACCPSPPGA